MMNCVVCDEEYLEADEIMKCQCQVALDGMLHHTWCCEKAHSKERE